MSSTNPSKPSRLAGFITVVLILVLVALASWALYELSTTTRGMAKHSLETESSRLASNLYFSKLTALAQLTVGLLGGAWAFLTLTETSVKMKGWATPMCFALANLSFALSLGIYVYGYDFIVARIFHHATFDIDAPFISSVSKFQQLMFLKGCLDLGGTILLGRGAS